MAVNTTRAAIAIITDPSIIILVLSAFGTPIGIEAGEKLRLWGFWSYFFRGDEGESSLYLLYALSILLMGLAFS